MNIKKNFGQQMFHLCNILFMILMVIVTLYPILHVVFASLSGTNALMMHTGFLLKPLEFTTGAYNMVFKNPSIYSGYVNTIYIVVVGVIINLILTSLGAYFLSRKDVLWKNAVMFMIIFTMFFQGGLIPRYFTVRDLGLDNTRWALILPVAVNTFNLIIMRTAFAGIPDSLEESAKLDGANHFVILFRIILPLSLPVVAVMTLYYTVGHWNAWFDAMIFLRSRALYPLQLILREVLIQNDTSSMSMGQSLGDQEAIGESIKYAVIMVSTLPVLFVYPFLQKYFVKGVMIGALKG